MQSMRARTVQQYPSSGGIAKCRECPQCDSVVEVTPQSLPQALKETRTCEVTVPQACELRPWHDWTMCSKSCGVGQRTRMRRIGTQAEYPGAVCEAPKNVLSEVGSCTITDCPSQDCVAAAWSQWSICLDRHSQSYRTRYISTPVLGDGLPCDGSLQETKPCPKPPVIDCTFSVWSEWSECDRTCDIGQRERSRTLTGEPKNGGTCLTHVVLKSTTPCQMAPCFPNVGPCVFSAWSPWTACPAKCGQGAIYRNRTVASLATDGGDGCEGTLNEIGSCEGTECGLADCKWSEWYDWSACTCTCGGGTKTRSRAVAQAPRLGGKL